MSYSDTKMC